jgi:RNA recognition motif-containing protein
MRSAVFIKFLPAKAAQCRNKDCILWRPKFLQITEKANIFVGNLAFTTTDQELRTCFEAYGTVDAVRIMTDWDTGRPRGFGFVEMPNGSEVQAAIAGLNGTSLGGRPLTVNEQTVPTHRLYEWILQPIE